MQQSKKFLQGVKSRNILGKCQHKKIDENVTIGHSEELWCQINDNAKADVLFNNMYGGPDKTLNEHQLMKLKGILTQRQIYDILDISLFDEQSGRLRSEDTLRELIDVKKDSGEYKRVLAPYLKPLSDPNNLCKIATSLLPKNKYTRGWTVVKLLGSGKFGTVLLVQNKKMQQRAIKLMTPNPDKDFLSPIQEASIQQLASEWTMAPEVHHVVKYKDAVDGTIKYMIIMGTVDFDLLTYLRCIEASFANKKERTKRYQSVVDALRLWLLKAKVHGLTHGDLHLGNVCVRFNKDKNALQLLAIDFGQSSLQVSWPEIDVAQFLRDLEGSSMSREIRQFFATGLNAVLKEMRGRDYKAVTGDDFIPLAKQLDDYMGIPVGMDVKRMVRAEKKKLKSLKKGNRKISLLRNKEMRTDVALRHGRRKIYSYGNNNSRSRKQT
jgi:hypothetical protein